MTPRERVLTALKLGQPDMVPWIENDIEEDMQVRVMGGRTDFTPGELCRALGMDGFGYHFPSGQRASDGQSIQTTGTTGKEAWYHPKRITFDFVPPWIADMGVDEKSGRTYVKREVVQEESGPEDSDRENARPGSGTATPARNGRNVWFGAGRWGGLVALAVRTGCVNRLDRIALRLSPTASRSRKGVRSATP